jgi:hypothetical protein
MPKHPLHPLRVSCTVLSGSKLPLRILPLVFPAACASTRFLHPPPPSPPPPPSHHPADRYEFTPEIYAAKNRDDTLIVLYDW